ncbi:hypothetical protein ScPMuIL_015087 [Solemya velum]
MGRCEVSDYHSEVRQNKGEQSPGKCTAQTPHRAGLIPMMEGGIKVSSTKKDKILKKKPKDYSCCMLYDVNAAMVALTGLSIAACNPSIEGLANARQAQEAIAAAESKPEKKLEHVVSTKMSCGYCSVKFTYRREQRDHYRSDWHRYNLKRRVRGAEAVDEDQFEAMEGNLSSISGSESDSADSDTGSDSSQGVKYSKPRLVPPPHLRHRQSSNSSTDSESEDTSRNYVVATRYAKVFFKNIAGEVVSLYRCVLYHKKEQPGDHDELLSFVKEAPQKLNWVVLMAAGGHFAGAVFNKDEVVTHKTFHRYVVRAKRGTAQGTRDSQGNAPKSAGASIRRYNEAALLQEVQELLGSWSEYMQKADIIFLRSPGFNKRLFFGGKNPPFKKDDPRIRMIPFQTRRPTFNELRRVREMLATVECYGDEADIENFVPISPSRRFSADTGRLEIVTDDPATSRNKKYKGKDKLGTSPLATQVENSSRPGPRSEADIYYVFTDHVVEERDARSSGTSETSDVELMSEMKTISTLELQEFDFTERHRKKKKKKIKKKKDSGEIPKHQAAPEGNMLDDHTYHLRNSMYTACKTGDANSLTDLLCFFHPVDLKSDELHDSQYLCSIQGDSNHNGDAGNIDDAGKSLSGTTNNIQENDIAGGEPVCTSELKRTRESCISQKPVVLDNASEFETRDGEMFDSIMIEGALKCESPSHSVNHYVVSTALLNESVAEKEGTLLHIAARSGHRKIVWLLMENGADPTVRDKYGKTSYAVTDDRETRNEFRRFMAKYPEKYQYEKSGIPSPLTPEMEIERKQKEAERKRLQRKTKAEKLKEKKAEEFEKNKEEEEKRKFLLLPEREKRALAAEKRLQSSLLDKQKEAPSVDAAVSSRCWQCGSDIGKKVPFEYYDFKFCKPKCLQLHRRSASGS